MSTQWKQSILLLKDKQTIKSRLEKGEKRNKFSTQVWNQQAADLRYKQKQRGDPEIHQQPQDERRS